MSIKKQIPEIEGVADRKAKEILLSVKGIVDQMTGRSIKPITTLSPNANTGGIINKVNEIINRLQGEEVNIRTVDSALYAPAFSGYANAAQTGISTGVDTKVAINTLDYDTSNAFDTANYRFTPKVRGYYYVHGVLRIDCSTLTKSHVEIYKNGEDIGYRGQEYTAPPPPPVSQSEVNATIYLDGEDDYLELYGYVEGTGITFEYLTGRYGSQFSAIWIRDK